MAVCISPDPSRTDVGGEGQKGRWVDGRVEGRGMLVLVLVRWIYPSNTVAVKHVMGNLTEEVVYMLNRYPTARIREQD